MYRADKKIYYPNNKINIQLLNDYSGIFQNNTNKKEFFLQKFNYVVADKYFLIINDLDTTYSNVISLSLNDTLIIYKNKMYFYNAEKKYLLYFKKKW